MTDKLAVSWLGFSLTAEGLWAIGGAIVIVAIVAGVMVLCRPSRKLPNGKKRLPSS